MTSAFIPISVIRLGTAEEELVLEVLRSGHLVQGPKVEQFEKLFATMCDARHAIAVNSGTTALAVTLEALDIGPGDEVLTSPLTFAATLNAILETGATARFADIEPEYFTLDPDAVAAAVTPSTRVVMPVHLYGQPADMSRLVPIAERAGAWIVEDAAQAHGATAENRPVGAFGIGCFSLYATKNVGTGEGGVVTTNDDTIADRLRLLRNQGMRVKYEYEVPGHNYRLTDMQAAIGIPQLACLAERNEQRRQHAARLTAGLSDVPGLITPAIAARRTHVFHQYTVRVTPDAGIDRDSLAGALHERGIGTGVYYPRLLFDYDCYRDHPHVLAADTPHAAAAAREVLSLPVHPWLSADDLDRIVTELRLLLGSRR